jgi:hypothetical protein
MSFLSSVQTFFPTFRRFRGSRHPAHACRAFRPTVECLENRLCPSAPGLTLVGSSFYGSASDNLQANGIAIAGGNIFLAGQDTTQSRGFLLQYSDPPGSTPASTATLSATTVLNGVATTPSGVTAVGYVLPPAYGAVDNVGGVEIKTLTTLWNISPLSLAGHVSGPVQPSGSTAFFSYSGGENLEAVAAANEAGTPFTYESGYAQANGVNNTAILAKYDAGGNLQWSQNVGNTGNFDISAGQAITLLNGNVYVAGVTHYNYNDPTTQYPALWEYTSSGSQVFAVQDTTLNGSFQGLTTLDGNLYAVGSTSSNGYLIEAFDPSGKVLWRTDPSATGTNALTGVVALANELFAVGYTKGGSGANQAVVLQVDPATGTILSQTLFGGGTLNTQAFGVATNGTDLYVTGGTSAFSTGGQEQAMLLRYTLGSPVNPLVVTTASDAISHTGVSLRDAIAFANTDAVAGLADTITFDPNLNGQTITLNQGQLELTAGSGAVRIDGAGQITVSGGQRSGIFQVDSGAQAVLSGLNLTEGQSPTSGGGIGNAGTLLLTNVVLADDSSPDGGGIYNTGELGASNIIVKGSTSGGGIDNAGKMTVDGGAVSGNFDTETAGTGAGISNSRTMTLSNLTISGNVISGMGSGIYNSGTMDVSDCNVSFNLAVSNTIDSQNGATAQGGGIWNSGYLSVSNSTLYHNSADGYGGGLYNDGLLTLANDTIAANTVFGVAPANTFPGGGGIFNTNVGILFLANTIVAGNTCTAVAGDPNSPPAPTPGIDPDVDGYVSGGNNNLFGNGTGLSGLVNGVAGNLIGTAAHPINPLLGPLADNGGPTQTMALLSGSPAIGAGGAVATLAVGISSSATTIVVAGFITSVTIPLKIGNEQVLVTKAVGNVFTVTRGYNGTTPSVHSGNTPVYLATDQRGAIRAGNPDIGAYAFTAKVAITAIVNDPTVNAGDTVTLTAAAVGSPAPAAQWQVSTNGGKTFHNIAGATSNVLTFTAQRTQNGNEYRVVFTNRFGRAVTPPADLFVRFAPVVIANPKDQTVKAGQRAMFSAAAIANPTAKVQWQVSSDGGKTFQNIPGATSTTLAFAVQARQKDDRFRAVFADALGEAISSAAVLEVH